MLCILGVCDAGIGCGVQGVGGAWAKHGRGTHERCPHRAGLNSTGAPQLACTLTDERLLLVAWRAPGCAVENAAGLALLLAKLRAEVIAQLGRLLAEATFQGCSLRGQRGLDSYGLVYKSK